MRRFDRMIRAVGCLAAIGFSSACGLKVASLDGSAAPPEWPSSPFPASVEVEAFDMPARDAAARRKYGVRALLEAIDEHEVFARIAPAGVGEVDPDLRLAGSIRSRWNPRSAANFFTWWPGGLIFAPNWRGTKMNFLAEAHLVLIDAKTSLPISKYDATVEYELVHRSNSPGPFFSAVVIIPGVINGITRTYPREKYRLQVEPQAFQELWNRIEGQITTDREGFFAERAREKRERCGDRLDRAPVIGQRWEDFAACQSRFYEAVGELTANDTPSRLYGRRGSADRIRVTNGEIVGWETVPTSPPGDAPEGPVSPPPSRWQ